MTTVTKTGDWRRARALLAAGPVRLKAAIAVAMRQEAEALRVMSRSIRNAREIDLNEDDADRLAWIIYNGLLNAGWSLK